jgi:hypothetical protein
MTWPPIRMDHAIIRPSQSLVKGDVVPHVEPYRAACDVVEHSGTGLVHAMNLAPGHVFISSVPGNIAFLGFALAGYGGTS